MRQKLKLYMEVKYDITFHINKVCNPYMGFSLNEDSIKHIPDNHFVMLE
jgi:hypothetical protein